MQQIHACLSRLELYKTNMTQCEIKKKDHEFALAQIRHEIDLLNKELSLRSDAEEPLKPDAVDSVTDVPDSHSAQPAL